MVLLTTDVRACLPEEAAPILAALGVEPAPSAGEGWFGAWEPVEDEALLELLLARVAVSAGTTDRAELVRRYVERHRALATEAVTAALDDHGVVPSLEGAKLRFGARGLPVEIALATDGWLVGIGRRELQECARERLRAHLAPVVSGTAGR